MKSGKKRIMLITPTMRQGGFERICVLTARLLSGRYDVYLVVFTMRGAFYDVSGLDLINLELGAVSGKIGKIKNVCRRAMRLKRLKRELGIDISYSFGTTANIVNVLSKGSETVWAGIRGYCALTDMGAGLIFKYADCVVSCTRTMEAEINKAFRTKKSRTLYNPCDLEEIKRLAAEPVPEKLQEFTGRGGCLITSMGREDDLKGFWHLIKSFAILKRTLADAKLMIIGDGSYDGYRELAEKLGVSDAVCFTGVQKNPFPLIAKSDVYALTSQSEGFPNALVEAMACGIPCVSVNCLTGPAEILHGNFVECADRDRVFCADYGILTGVFHGEKDMDASRFTPEEERFADELKKLLEDEALCRHYRQKASRRAEDFGMERYLENISGLIGEDW